LTGVYVSGPATRFALLFLMESCLFNDREAAMAKKVERFEDLIAWQKARNLTKRVYLLSMGKRFANDYALTNQMRRAAISVPSNIAEGFERGRRAEFHQFLAVAKSSCAEFRTQIYIALDIGYVDEVTARSVLEEAEEVARIVGGLRRAVEKQKPGKAQSSVPSPQSS
jgi:four helix bundle protein